MIRDKHRYTAALRKHGPIVRQMRYLAVVSHWYPSSVLKQYPHEERIGLKGIEMHLDPRGIANDLEQQATDQSAQVTPCSVTDAKEELDQEQPCEDGQV